MTTSTTLTITEAPTQPVFFHLALKAPKPEPTRFSVSTGLGAILIKYEKEQDPPSKNLRTAGREFMVYAVENYSQPLDAILQGSIEKIEGIKRALKNPFSPLTCREPWLIDGIVIWDRPTVDENEDYRKRFSGRPLEAVPHRFAQEVVDWIDELPPALNSPVALLQLTSQGTQPCLPKDVQDYQRYKEYGGMIETAHELKRKEGELQRTIARVQQLEVAKGILEVANTQGFQRFRLDIARQEESQITQHAELGRGLVSLQAQQQETIALHEEANDVVNAALRHVKGDLEEAHIKMDRQQAEIRNLYGQLYSCQAQLSQMGKKEQNSCSLL